MPPVVCVRIRDGLNSGPQQLVPQEGSVGHGVCKKGGSESGGGPEPQDEGEKRGKQSDLCWSPTWRLSLCGSGWESGSSPAGSKERDKARGCLLLDSLNTGVQTLHLLRNAKSPSFLNFCFSRHTLYLMMSQWELLLLVKLPALRATNFFSITFFSNC